MEDFKKFIKSQRPKLSENSIRTYSSMLGNLYMQIEGKKEVDKDITHFFFKNVKKVITTLKDLNVNRRKTLLAGLVVLCDGEDEKACEQYRKEMLDVANNYKKNEQDQKMTETQRENWVTQDDVKKLYAQLDKECRPYLSREKLSLGELNRLQNFIILSLYVLQAPRRLQDYTEFKLRNIDEEKDNYISKNKLIFNTYKTAKKYGREEVDLNPKLKFILNKWKNLNDSDYLLVGVTGKKFSQSQLQQRLASIFGKPVSVNILRHSYLTEKYKDIPLLTEMTNTAKEMGHSVQQALEYVKKDAPHQVSEEKDSEVTPKKKVTKRKKKEKIQAEE